MQVHNQLGGLRTKQKKYDMAMAQFNESLKLNPNQADISHSLAQMLLTCPDQVLRDPSRAVELAQQACELTQSKDPRYLNTLAVAHFKTRNYSKAAKTCQKALALVQAQGDHKLAAKLQKQLDLIKGNSDFQPP